MPELHEKQTENVIPVSRLATLLLDPAYTRDGVTILGGEPFAQPAALLALIKELRSRDCQHIVCYSGYTLESLQMRSKVEAEIGEILNQIDVLIDGPYIQSLAGEAGLWTGSGNQRVIDLAAERAKGRKKCSEN